MFYRIVFVCIAIFSSSAYAASGSIQDRVNAAQRLENSAQEAPYQARIKASIGPHINTIIKECASQQSTRPAPFVLVADITADGSLSDVELVQSSPFAECFADSLSQLQFPAIPDNYPGTTYPIVLNMSFH